MRQGLAPAAVDAELLALETALARRDPSGLPALPGGLGALARRDPRALPGGLGVLGALVADDFLEFGRSGRVYDAASIRALLAAGKPSELAFEPRSFTVDLLAPDVALVTYEIGTPARTNRASVWVRRDGRWLIRFHQGTPAEEPA